MLKIADNQLQWIRYCCAKMVFSKENNILIKSLRELKGCEKLFTVAAQTNSERSFYVRQGTRKKDVNENRLLRMRSTFSKSVVVSVGISKLGCTDIHFIELGTKVNWAYYRDNLLAQKLLPDMRWLAQNEFFCVPTGRRPGASSTRHRRFPGSRDAGLHSSNTVTTEFAGL